MSLYWLLTWWTQELILAICKVHKKPILATRSAAFSKSFIWSGMGSKCKSCPWVCYMWKLQECLGIAQHEWSLWLSIWQTFSFHCTPASKCTAIVRKPYTLVFTFVSRQTRWGIATTIMGVEPGSNCRKSLWACTAVHSQPFVFFCQVGICFCSAAVVGGNTANGWEDWMLGCNHVSQPIQACISKQPSLHFYFANVFCHTKTQANTG